jgi:hypothetical protein
LCGIFVIPVGFIYVLSTPITAQYAGIKIPLQFNSYETRQNPKSHSPYEQSQSYFLHMVL